MRKLPFRTLAEGWKYLYDTSNLKNTSLLQQREMRKAFYIGASVAFDIQVHIVGEDTCSEEEGMKILSAIEAELKQFADDLKHNRV